MRFSIIDDVELSHSKIDTPFRNRIADSDDNLRLLFITLIHTRKQESKMCCIEATTTTCWSSFQFHSLSREGDEKTGQNDKHVDLHC